MWFLLPSSPADAPIGFCTRRSVSFQCGENRCIRGGIGRLGRWSTIDWKSASRRSSGRIGSSWPHRVQRAATGTAQTTTRNIDEIIVHNVWRDPGISDQILIDAGLAGPGHQERVHRPTHRRIQLPDPHLGPDG